MLGKRASNPGPAGGKALQDQISKHSGKERTYCGLTIRRAVPTHTFRPLHLWLNY